MGRKIALVTGGSRGIGAAIAIRLARDGYDIWLNYRKDEEAARSVADTIQGYGGECKLLSFDVRSSREVNDILLPMLEADTPYAVIHNAGVTRDGVFALMPKEDWELVVSVSLGGFFNVVRPVVRSMLTKRTGRVVVISSVSGRSGQAGQVNYSAAKAGLIGAAKALAKEVARRNVLVNVIAPGLVDTDMTANAPKEKILPLIPLGRIGTAEDIAGAVSFLLGPDSSYITGQVIGIDGGLYM